MHDIEMHVPSDDFARCWQAAGRHLQAQMHDGQINWLKANLTAPFLEHLSFRLGNQLFFIRIDDVDGKIIGPGNPNGFRTIAEGCKGVACRMPMKFNGQAWETAVLGWGLVNDQTGQVIDPFSLVNDEKIEMTDWEIQDFSVQVVCDMIQKTPGREIITSQGNPKVDPSIWFVGEKGPEWVIVRVVKYPENQAKLPENIKAIAAGCSAKSKIGYFASVALASSDESFDSEKTVTPLWRGHGMFTKFDGLEPINIID